MSTNQSNTISPEAARDIRELEERITSFKKGDIIEDRFKAYRLTRGVYGQRQPGVQMFRIKIPGGKLNAAQLTRIADVSEEYTNGNLHLTTRQDIQLHYVHLEDTPDMWTRLEETGITTREACGNTVRNITVSSLAGVDPEEPFDVTPYADATFRFLLRNPICQDMGRKIKISFSSSEQDTAFGFMHDFGLIPRVQNHRRGFKVLLGGGLGAQAILAKTAYEFLPAEELIPFLVASLRIFDRYGEREKRFKARLKFLVDEKRGIGHARFLELVKEEWNQLSFHTYEIDPTPDPIQEATPAPSETTADPDAFQAWLHTNVVTQKQEGLVTIKVQVPRGDIQAGTARQLAHLVSKYAADRFRVTINQGLHILHVPEKSLPFFYARLSELGLAQYGAETLADVTACPGTDTCNLGVTNSMGVAEILEEQIRDEFAHFINDQDLHIKISGCMNACGQHMIANIGFHGSSIKHNEKVVPALQVVIGGGQSPEGEGLIADKVIKLPTKRVKETLRLLLDDYETNGEEGEYFNQYYQRLGKKYFYDLLKPLADLETLKDTDYIDWGEDLNFVPEIGVGECAGVMYDVVGTIIQDSLDKLEQARESVSIERYADAAYHAYGAYVIGAKALLLSRDVHCNTHIGIIQDFDKHFVQSGEFEFDPDFQSVVLKNEAFNNSKVQAYLRGAEGFVEEVITFRQKQLETGDNEKPVVGNFYKA